MAGKVLRRAIQISVLLLLGSLLSGCLLTRVYEFKNQFCDYQQNFQLLLGDELMLSMRNPVLRDRDIIWLMGAAPSYREQGRDGLDLVYVIEKDLPQSDPQYAIPLRLRFMQQQGQYLLKAGIISHNLSSMITPGLIDEIIVHTCDADSDFLKRSITVDLSGLDRQDVPHRSEIESALGPPGLSIEAGRVVEYQYRLKDAQPGVEKSSARIWYSEGGEQVERIHFSYFRYQFDVNFETGEGVISIAL